MGMAPTLQLSTSSQTQQALGKHQQHRKDYRWTGTPGLRQQWCTNLQSLHKKYRRRRTRRSRPRQSRGRKRQPRGKQLRRPSQRRNGSWFGS